MKDFVDTYAKALENQHVLMGQVHREFKTNCDDLTVQKLIQTFIEAKATGREKPGLSLILFWKSSIVKKETFAKTLNVRMISR